MRIFKYLFVLLLLIVLSQTALAELKDPRTRDEDLSRTKISVNYTVLPSGLYEYYYDIKSPIENKGIIFAFLLNLSCDYDFGQIAFDEPAPEIFKNRSRTGLHVPVQADGVMYHTIMASVTVDEKMMWAGLIEPGKPFKDLD